MTALALVATGRTSVGRRANNEDAFFVSPRLVAVADGVGGHAAGEIASRVMVDALGALEKAWLDEPLQDALAATVRRASETIAFIADRRPEAAGMATTLTAVAIVDDRYVVANVGDSRTYLLRDGDLRLLTHDDSYVQALVDDGLISVEEAREHPQRSVVLKAVDGRDGVDPALTTIPARDGDRLLLCSDGLTDVMGDDAIGAELRGSSAADASDRLVDAALTAGSRDNVTVVVADVVAAGAAEPSWDRPASD